jgi:hypothetical protein
MVCGIVMKCRLVGKGSVWDETCMAYGIFMRDSLLDVVVPGKKHVWVMAGLDIFSLDLGARPKV